MKQILRRGIVLLCLCALCPLLAACGSQSQPAKDVPVDTILTNIRAAYGDDYIPNSEIPAELLESVYGLAADMYVEIGAEMALISTFPDTVIVAKAADGKGDAVEQALNTARDNAISNTLQYPMNVPKTNATKVVRRGDYVAFLMVGAVGDFEDAQSAESKQFAEDEVQKGVDAFHASFQ
ncbi:DUF4358 domain-containing protein [Ruminococcaceae bacterium OttesenSCG-928-L11]|nr:DUF4358 domain-containing protein [Ruminococcaceae bacterium OttesenSCG-928-L11]